MLRSRLGICAALAMFMLSGCAGFGKRFETPRISLVNVEIREAKLLETVFNVELRIINTNEIPIIIKGLECRLEINGKDLALGITDTVTEIPAFGTVRLPITLYSSVVDMVRSALHSSRHDSFSYKVTGKLRLESDAWIPSVIPFSSDGELGKDSVRKF